jgi:hypothetical protein
VGIVRQAYSGGVSIRLGYQMPNYSYGTPVAQLFPTVAAQAREARGSAKSIMR